MAKKKRQLTPELAAQLEDQLASASMPYNYDTKEYPIEVILAKYAKEEIFVPPYQRGFIWKANQRACFIESLFLGVPIMPIFVSVSGDNAELEVIDGSQRIRTIVEYCNNNLKLQGLEALTMLNGTYFSDLPVSRQNKFKLRDIRVHVVTDKADAATRADIFKRVNTSSSRLTPSETRKGAYQSDFYQFIIDSAKDPLLRELCPISDSKIKRGEYDELVLRFFAYSEEYLKFKHDVAPFLDAFVRNHKDDFDKDALSSKFQRMLSFVKNTFPKPYFARSINDGSTPRVRFEALSVGVHLALEEDSSIHPTNFEWLNSIEFKRHTTSDASNNPGRLRDRVEFVRDVLLGRITSFRYADNEE